jgi:ubiquinone/menaquinone biosynthesis C-methylase UbiE
MSEHRLAAPAQAAAGLVPKAGVPGAEIPGAEIPGAELSRAAWLSEWPDTIRAALEAYVAGAAGPEMVLLQVLMLARSSREATEMLERMTLLATGRVEPEVAGRLEQLQRMDREHRGAWQIVARTLELVDGAEASAGIELEPAQGCRDETDGAAARRLSELATRFDRAAGLCPEASVALYSLGEPARLAAATAEIAQRLRDWGLLGHEWSYLDIGCGIGRIEQALWPEVGFITGIDISPKMVELARERCTGVPNVAFRLANGRDLSGFGAASMDVILAVDSFPYLVRCGAGLAERHLSEAVRVLKPRGQLAIFNFSYQGELAADRAEVARLAARMGLAVVRQGVRGLCTWDGAGYHLIKSS